MQFPDRKHAEYEYVCESPSKQALIQIHRILIKQNRAATSFKRWMLVLALLASTQVHWILAALVALAFLISRRNGVEQEAVVVMPTLGIQLETVYRSKHVKRRFVPLHRVLRPVINEAVTPTTCFTYLALLLRDDSKLTLTFLHVRPPLSMLVPIWTSLCAAVSHHPPKRLLRNS